MVRVGRNSEEREDSRMGAIHDAASRGDVGKVTPLLRGGFFRRAADINCDADFSAEHVEVHGSR